MGYIMFKRVIIAVACALAAGSAQSATVTTFTDGSAFDAAVVSDGALFTENFNSFATDVSLGGGPVNVPTANPRFTVETPVFNPTTQNKIDAPPFSTTNAIDGTTYIDALLRRPLNTPVEFLQIVFPEPVFAFGADFAGIDPRGSMGNSTQMIGVSVNVPGGPQVSNLPSTMMAGFFGLVSDEAFTVVRVLVFGNDVEDRIGMDNFRYAEFTTVIPLPVTLPMFLGALALLGFMTRRRVAA